MKIGFYFNFNNEQIGGSFIFQKNFLMSLLNLKNEDINFVAIVNTKQIFEDFMPDLQNVKYLKDNGRNKLGNNISHRVLKKFFPKTITKILNRINISYNYINTNNLIYGDYNNSIQDIVISEQIDFLYFVHPSYSPVKVPFGITVWDLAHRKYPFLPEESYLHNNFEIKDNFFRNVLSRASLITTGTLESKKQISQYYSIDEDLIFINPFPVQKDLIECEPVNFYKELPENYFYYPAQFWPQKNHILIIEALKLLNSQGIKFNCVFSGSDQGNLKYIEKKIKEYNLGDQITIVGFIERGQMNYLYKNCIALVFPAIMGPDNIPPIEAMSLGCPVITGNYEGVDDQLLDGAIIFNRFDECDLAEKMKLIATDLSLRMNLIERGIEIIKIKGDFDTYIKALFGQISFYSKVLRTWKDC